MNFGLNLNLTQNVNVTKTEGNNQLSFLESLGIKDQLPSQRNLQIAQDEEKEKQKKVQEEIDLKLEIEQHNLTNQIFVHDRNAGNVVPMETKKKQVRQKKNVGVDDFRDDKSLSSDDIYNLNVDYLLQEKLDKASINDLLVSEFAFKIKRPEPLVQGQNVSYRYNSQSNPDSALDRGPSQIQD